MAELIRITQRVWIYPFEDERDRPVLGYIRGDKRAFAVDAGHSDAHIREFYDALEKNGLPLPDVTVITHWHWDHSFAMHCLHGLSLASETTNRHLAEFRERFDREAFLAMDPCIAREYADGRAVNITLSDIEYREAVGLDGGGITLKVFETVSPHTDDTTLVLVNEERILFTGDAVCGEYPSEYAEADKVKSLMDTIQAAEADLFAGGHWKVMSKAEVLAVLEKML